MELYLDFLDNYLRDCYVYDEQIEIELMNKEPDSKLSNIIDLIAEDARNWANQDVDFKGGEPIDHFHSLPPDYIRGFCQEHSYYEEWAHLTVSFVDFNKLMRVRKWYYEKTARTLLAIFDYYYEHIEPKDKLKQMANPSADKQTQDLEKEFEEICKEQEKLYRPGFETVFSTMGDLNGKQTLYYKTDFWDMSYKLPDKPDLIPINVALAKTGFSNDKGFCDDFIRYCTITLRGKKIMQQQAHINAINLNNQTIQVKGWIFKPMAIYAPADIQRYCIDKLYENAVLTKTRDKTLSEYMDSFANANMFQMKCNLVTYIDKLEKFNIINSENSFLDKEKTLVLLKSLNVVLDSIKNNSNKIYKAKHEISEFIKKFDSVKVWGLLMQILILEGICELFLQVDLKYDDPGYDEAQSLCEYIGKELEEKEIIFCLMPYGPKDLQRLEPLCDFLMHTEIGKFIQEGLSKDVDTLNKYTKTSDENKYFKVIRTATAATNWENNTRGRFVDIDETGDYRFLPSTVGKWWDLKDISFIKNGYYDTIKRLPIIASGLIPQYIRWEEEKDVKQIFDEYYNACFETFKTRARSNIKLMLKSANEIETAYIETLNKEELARIKKSLKGLFPFIPKSEQKILTDVGDCFIDFLNDKHNTIIPPAKNKPANTLEITIHAESVTNNIPDTSPKTTQPANETIDDYIIADNPQAFKTAMTKLLKGKKGKTAAYYIQGAVLNLYMEKPSFKILQSAFKIVGRSSGFDHYYNGKDHKLNAEEARAKEMVKNAYENEIQKDAL